ncbi:Bcr/CflA family efflux MFS transporter [Conexibacter arvalis]|uniref:DHA1 family bicyclomycin/chloramphenicol resistance-like MFS transporter n=1 Tax=Conexibacter arvalis TaxID=912552 RepID=A0A840IHF5_9ACTN|nr:DHA1 family bicyclomycin/chloramphenicol resistance-like MFS transporter [Conexibacter arvalis]
MTSITRRSRTRAPIVALGALTAFGPLSLDMYLPGLPELSRDLGTSAPMTQLTLTACMIGLAAGQLLAGPLSDARGRRRPLLAGLALYALVSALCAVAPSIWTLIPLRLVQGAAGAAGIVIARAVVRDLHEGEAAARAFALLTLVNGLSPIVAPIAGGQLLGVTDWRGVFWALAAVGVVLFLVGWRWVPETLPAQARHRGGFGATIGVFGRLLRDRVFVGYTLAQGLGAAMMFCYIAGSPFVLQDIHGLSAQAFSVAFAVNALGIVLLAQLSGRLAGAVAPRRLLAAGLWLGVAGAAGLLAAVVLGGGLVAILPSFFAIVSSYGLVAPNATALALAGDPSTAGSAAALLGLSQFALGGAFAPLAGIGGAETALPLALVIAGLGAASVAAFALLARPDGRGGSLSRSR